jgi:2-phospho-L-lactate guanylyltransferase
MYALYLSLYFSQIDLNLPGIAMDIDHPADIARFAHIPEAKGTQTLAWLTENGILSRLA